MSVKESYPKKENKINPAIKSFSLVQNRKVPMNNF